VVGLGGGGGGGGHGLQYSLPMNKSCEYVTSHVNDDQKFVGFGFVWGCQPHFSTESKTWLVPIHVNMSRLI